MSRICQICGKGRLKGNLVPRLIGRRVSHRSTSFQGVNLRNKKLLIDGKSVRVKLCASCLSTINRNNKTQEDQAK